VELLRGEKRTTRTWGDRGKEKKTGKRTVELAKYLKVLNLSHKNRGDPSDSLLPTQKGKGEPARWLLVIRRQRKKEKKVETSLSDFTP